MLTMYTQASRDSAGLIGDGRADPAVIAGRLLSDKDQMFLND